MATSKQISKPAAKQVSKAPSKAAAKQAPKAPTLIYAAILGEALAGKFGNVIQRFYVNAIGYHKKQGTTFPRARVAGIALMDEKQTREFIEKHKATSIPAGNTQGQRVFDQMMVETQAAK